MFTIYRRTLCVVFVYIIFRMMLLNHRNISQTQVATIKVSTTDVNLKRHSEVPEEYECHYLKDNGFLPRVTEYSTFPSNSIYFIDSSCNDLTSRKACSIESAARANPERQVIVLSTSPMSKNNSIIKKLLSLNNTSALRIHLDNYAEGTPLDGKFRKKLLNFEDINMDLADILKFVTLYKYSGVYLSMDVIVARKFENLSSNWIVKEKPTKVSSDMFSFSADFNGRAMAHVAMNVIVNNLAVIEGEVMFRFDSGFVLPQFVSMWCGVTDILYLNESNCQDLGVGLPENFFPIPFRFKQNYFRPGTLNQWKDRVIYTYPIWEIYTKKNRIKEDSLFTILAKTYCPMTYKFYKNKLFK